MCRARSDEYAERGAMNIRGAMGAEAMTQQSKEN